jgi:hypothetical protein
MEKKNILLQLNLLRVKRIANARTIIHLGGNVKQYR